MASTKKSPVLERVAAASLPLAPSGATAINLHVVGARPGTSVEIQPGKTFLPLPPENVNTLALAELVPVGDGTFRPVVRICPRWFTVSRRDLRKLNIPISEMTLRRLITAGFVKGEPVSPGITQFDFFSYLEHVRRVGEDPEFWDKTEPPHNFTNRERYRQAL